MRACYNGVVFFEYDSYSVSNNDYFFMRNILGTNVHICSFFSVSVNVVFDDFCYDSDDCVDDLLVISDFKY